MKSERLTRELAAVVALGMMAGTMAGACAAPTDGMERGAPDVKSAGSLAFGPEGILFVADPKGAAVVAIATGDTESAGEGSLEVEGIGKKVAAMLGTTEEEMMINDLAVNPASGAAFLSVSLGRGPDAQPVLVRVKPGGDLELVELDDVEFSTVSLSDAPEDGEVGEGRRRSNPRMESITDIAYLDGKVVIAGLSNEEFASTLRTVEFPFTGEVAATSVEIYHGAHGRLETSSPIRTFLPMAIDGEPNIVASYTCTPLVRIPMGELKPSGHVTGTTVAELGNRNRPLDMVEYEKGGERFILMANSSRGVMKVEAGKIGEIEGLTERVDGDGTAGLPYETVEDWKGVVQLDKLNDTQALVIRQGDDGAHSLAQVELL
ncbi:hypothetical protein BH23VER1_BH23VER1_33180 [soil metagenome]